MVRQHTIVALSSAQGYAGIAVIRLSGKNALAIAEQLCGKKFLKNKTHYSNLYDVNGDSFDQAIVLYFPKPASFTGEDIVEIQMHGSPVLIELCLKRLYELGAKPAEAGEFSERAFLNDKVDLSQAEAIMDIIHAKSIQAAKAAKQILEGRYSQKIDKLAEKILNLRTQIELALDFPDEEVLFIDRAKIRAQLDKLVAKTDVFIAGGEQTKLQTRGAKVAIVGSPNVGKSTLLNALLQEDRAIVSNIAGTTRDTISQMVNLQGLIIEFLDTAGIHQTKDEIEQEGIKRTYQSIEQADLVLYLTDKEEIPIEFKELSANKLLILTKCDLLNQPIGERNIENIIVSNISAKFNQGIDLLREKIKNLLNYNEKEAQFSIKARHYHLFLNCHQYLEESIQQLDTQLELTAESLKLAHEEIQQITGKVLPDDILGKIFSEFCIGK